MSIEVQPVDGILIRSEVVVFPSRNGQKIVGYIDSADSAPSDAEYVIVTPKFGESKKNSLQMAYQLAANGLRVLRFDHTNHVGESAGDIEDYTFSGAIGDMHAAIDFLELQCGVSRVQLIANSLSARCALRVAATDTRVSRLITMVGVVNFQHTASVVYQRDMVAEFSAGKMQGISDILGHQVNVDAFLEDCIGSNLHTIDGSLEDIHRVGCEVIFFSAERDIWVDLEEVMALRDASDLVSLSVIEGAMHELRENPTAAEDAGKALIYACKHGQLASGNFGTILGFPKKQLFEQNRIERGRLRAAAPLRESEQDFWKAYLHKYDILEAVGDYQEYLELIGACLGKVDSKMVYFDCGCGNGMYGAWCVRDYLMTRTTLELAESSPIYFGLDLTAKGLSEASRRHIEAGKDFKRGDSVLNTMYFRYDLDDIDLDAGAPQRLPLEGGSVDRICCSLLISYLKRPDFLLRELYRILKPGGIIIVSSMKPFCDLSVIYKDVVDEAKGSETLQSARDLLSAAGAIKLKEEEGHYKFYEQSELLSAVAEVGFREGKVYRSFGDQANLVCAKK